MSLLHPTPGEVMDRLSIVGLKIEAYQKSAKPTSRLKAEERELREYLKRWSIPEILSMRLIDINQTIWDAEDAVRAWRTDYGHDALCEYALRIAKYNDYRSNVIREIDQACGVRSIERKIYSDLPK